MKRPKSLTVLAGLAVLTAGVVQWKPVWMPSSPEVLRDALKKEQPALENLGHLPGLVEGIKQGDSSSVPSVQGRPLEKFSGKERFSGLEFVGFSSYSGKHSLDEVQRLGVQKEAEMKALAACKEVVSRDGSRNCLVIGSGPAECKTEQDPRYNWIRRDIYSCSSSARAQVLSDRIRYKRIDRSASREAEGSRDMMSDTLFQQGVRKVSENVALEACRGEGFLACGVVTNERLCHLELKPNSKNVLAWTVGCEGTVVGY